MSDARKVLWRAPGTVSGYDQAQVIADGEDGADFRVLTTTSGYGRSFLYPNTSRALRLLADERTALEAERDSLRKLVDALRSELRAWLPSLPVELQPGDYTKLAMLAGERPAEAGGEEGKKS